MNRVDHKETSAHSVALVRRIPWQRCITSNFIASVLNDVDVFRSAFYDRHFETNNIIVWIVCGGLIQGIGTMAFIRCTMHQLL